MLYLRTLMCCDNFFTVVPAQPLGPQKFEVGSAVKHGTQYGVIRLIMKSQPDGMKRAQIELVMILCT